jgi:hypothetical protein
MALPAHLQRYSGLIDLVVEALVREAQGGAETERETPGRGRIRPGAIQASRGIDDDESTTPAPRAQN